MFEIFERKKIFKNHTFLSKKHFLAKREGFLWRKAVQNKPNDWPIQTEPGQMECQTNEINFLFSLALANGGIDVGDPMLKIENFCVRPRHRNTKK